MNQESDSSRTEMKPLLGSVPGISVGELVRSAVEVVISPFVVKEEDFVRLPGRSGGDGSPTELGRRQPDARRRQLLLVFRQILRDHWSKE